MHRFEVSNAAACLQCSNGSRAGSIASESWECGLSDEVAVAEPPGVDRILKRDGAGVDVEDVFLHQSLF